MKPRNPKSLKSTKVPNPKTNNSTKSPVATASKPAISAAGLCAITVRRSSCVWDAEERGTRYRTPVSKAGDTSLQSRAYTALPTHVFLCRQFTLRYRELRLYRVAKVHIICLMRHLTAQPFTLGSALPSAHTSGTTSSSAAASCRVPSESRQPHRVRQH